MIFTVCIFSCAENPCRDLVNGVYQFPELPDKHNMTREEITRYWDLPEDVGECIPTEGLIETCMNYPELRLIMAGLTPLHGYLELVKKRFLGARILEMRPDRATCLLKKYKTFNPTGYNPNWENVEIGRYIFKTDYFEIIFSQPANLEVLSEVEVIELLEKALSVYKEKKNDPNQGYFSLGCTAALIGRLMFQKEYEPLLKEYNENDLVKSLIKYYLNDGLETSELIITLSMDFLNQLKIYRNDNQ